MSDQTGATIGDTLGQAFTQPLAPPVPPPVQQPAPQPYVAQVAPPVALPQAGPIQQPVMPPAQMQVVGGMIPQQVLTPQPPVMQQMPSAPVIAAASLINGVNMSRFVKALIYAEPGAGKTVFAATAPKPLIIDTENSTEVLGDWPELLAEAKIVRLVKWEHLDALIQAIRAGDPAFADRQTLVLDTVSELQRRNLDELLDFKAGIDKSRNRFLAHQGDYKESGEMMRRIVTSLRDLDMHLIVLAHAKEVNDNGSLVMRPDLTPKLQDTMRGIFGIQGFMYEQNDDWNAPFTNYLQTRSNAVVQAKSRYRFLPPIVQNPTFGHVLAAAHHRFQETTGTQQLQGAMP